MNSIRGWFIEFNWRKFLLSFKGRTSRKDYWLRFFLPYLFISVLFTTMPLIQSIWGLATIWPICAVTFKRYHNRNLSGWWSFLLPVLVLAGSFIDGIILQMELVKAEPEFSQYSGAFGFSGFILGLAFVAYVLCLRGTRGSNKFGPDPLIV